MRWIRSRLARLERAIKPEPESIIVVSWGDDEMVTVKGERMSLAEVDKQYPDMEVINLHVVYQDNPNYLRGERDG